MLAELFEFKAEQEILGGMSEEEFKRRAVEAIQRLRYMCKNLGGKFIAHSDKSATCVFPEGIEVGKIRVAKLKEGGIFPSHYVEIYARGAREEFNIVADEFVDVYIGGDVVEGIESARLTSGQGGELGGRWMKVGSISVRTDWSGRRAYVEIL